MHAAARNDSQLCAGEELKRLSFKIRSPATTASDIDADIDKALKALATAEADGDFEDMERLAAVLALLRRLGTNRDQTKRL